jgi:hypothetical protein
MDKDKPDIQADILPVLERGENSSLMEPLVLSSSCRARSELTDLRQPLCPQGCGRSQFEARSAKRSEAAVVVHDGEDKADCREVGQKRMHQCDQRE